MTSTPVPSTCAICGAPGAGSPCARCAAEAAGWVGPPRDTDVPAGATAAENVVATAVDGAVLAASAGLGALVGRLLGLGGVGVGVLALAALAAALVAVLRRFTTTGRTPGLAAAGLRALSPDTGYPPTVAGRQVRASLRRGPDPLAPRPEGLVPRAPTAPRRARASGRSGRGWALVQAGQLRVPVHGPTVVGRFPAPAGGLPHHERVDINDLSRSMSRNHLLLEPTTDGALWVTDLGSANGTRVSREGVLQQLPPRQPVRAEPGMVVVCGDLPLVLVHEGGSR